jgi:hypothetical protein
LQQVQDAGNHLQQAILHIENVDKDYMFKWVLYLSEYSEMFSVRQKESRNLSLNLCFLESFLWWYINTDITL